MSIANGVNSSMTHMSNTKSKATWRPTAARDASLEQSYRNPKSSQYTTEDSVLLTQQDSKGRKDNSSVNKHS